MDTPASLLTARSEHLARRIDSGFAPEIYANAARLITEHEQREGVTFVPVPTGLADRLADTYAGWVQAEQADPYANADRSGLAEVVAETLAILASLPADSAHSPLRPVPHS